MCLPFGSGLSLMEFFTVYVSGADRMCGACQHAPVDERLERVWK